MGQAPQGGLVEAKGRLPVPRGWVWRDNTPAGVTCEAAPSLKTEAADCGRLICRGACQGAPMSPLSATCQLKRLCNVLLKAVQA